MRVLIPVDHLTPGQDILDRCRRFADVGDCAVVLAHVVPEGTTSGSMESYLTDATRTLRQAGVDARYILREGEPGLEIAHLAHELDACLLVPA